MKLTKRDLALLGIIVYFTFIGGTFYSQLNFSLRVLNQIVVTALLGIWLLAKLRKREGLPHTYLDLAMALYLVVNLVSAVWGQSPRFSLESIWFSIVHVLGFYLLVDLLRRGWTARLTWAFYMASAVVCLVGLIEFMAWYVGTPVFANFAQGWWEIGGWRQPIPPRIYRLAITLNGSTPLAAYLALLIPPAIGLVISLPRRNENRQALIFWLVLAFLVQILTFSRAGVLALGVSLTVAVLGWLKVMGRGWPDLTVYWSRLRPLQRTIIIVGGVVIVGVGLFWLQSSFVNRVHSTQFRFTLWQAAVTVFQDNIVTGAGPANFGRALLRLNEASLPRWQIATAHSIYFNTAAELGLIGLMVGGYFYLMIGRAWRERWRQTADPAGRMRLVAGGAALVGLAAQLLVDTYTATPNVLVILAVLAYIVGPLVKTASPTRRPYTASLALVILLVYAVGFGWITLADFRFQKSFQEEGSGNLSAAVAQASRAHTLDPNLTLRTFRLALLEARLADQTGDRNLMQAAVTHYQTGLQQEPILGLNSANLAGLLWQQGQQAEAIDTLQRTIVAEEAPLYWVNLGYFYEQAGDWAQAKAAYGQALLLAPSLAASGFWQASPARAEKWPDIVAAVVEQTPPDETLDPKWLQVNIVLAQEDFDEVEALIGPVTATTREQFLMVLAELYLSRGQPEQASALLDPNPETGQDYLLWGRVKWQQGDEATAEKLLKTAVFLDQREAYYYLGQLYEQQGDWRAAEAAYGRGFLPHATAENIEVTIYGRPGANDLAPQLVRIGVGPRQAKAWLALARLYEGQQRFDEARRVYEILLAEDPFLVVAQERLDLLAGK